MPLIVDRPIDASPGAVGLIGVLLRGATAELDAAAAACRLAGDRRRSLAVFAPSPRVFMSAALTVGVDPVRLERAVILDQRRKLTELLDRAGVQTGFSVTPIKGHAISGAIRAAEGAGCSSLVIPGCRRTGRPTWCAAGITPAAFQP